MAIIGNAFDDYVKKQIETRQKALGQGLSQTDPRTLDTLKAFNSNAPWIRLASAVSITEGIPDLPGESVLQQIEKSGLFSGFDWKEDSLSKNFVLMGAPTNQTGNGRPSGVNNGSTNSDGGLETLYKAYGYGSTLAQSGAGRGYVPPPGIMSANFEYKNDGALAVATINIKAFSETQFSMIDILFQRPGYTCLLEFGHTTFLGNDGKLKVAGKDVDFNTSPFEFLYKANSKDVNYTNLAKKITEEKKKWQGNYEGFFGRITKFNWKFNEDGSYDITVKLTGTGDVISSLKVTGPKVTAAPLCQTPSFINPPSEGDRESAAKEGGILISDSISSQLNFELYSIFKNTGFYPLKKNATSSDITLTKIPIDNTLKDIKISKGVFKVDVNDWGGTDYSPITSIKFGGLLAILQKLCNIKDSSGNHMLSFSMVEDLASGDVNNDDTYIVTYPGNFSSNPTKCLIQLFSFEKSYSKGGKTFNIAEGVILPKTLINKHLSRTPSNEKVGNTALAMRLSDVYVDVGFVAKCLKDLRGQVEETDDEVEIPLLDLLKSILSGINTSLGGLNNFRVLFNDVTNKIDIISESPILATKPKKDSYAIINTFGLTVGEGSFIKNMDLNSELTDNMATQISIGAQANSTTMGGGATSFSTYSKGLVDRMFAEKISSVDDTKTQTAAEIEKEDKINTIFNEDVLEAFNQVYNDREFGDKYIPVLEGIVSNVSKIIINRYTQSGASQVPMFLPFNLNLTMHGLGGMKIYQAFQVQGRGLPVTYNPKNISCIIKSLSHTIDGEGWNTKVSILSTPLVEAKATSNGSNEFSTQQNGDNTTYSSDNTNSNQPLSEVPAPASLNPTSKARFEAMQKSYNAVFKRDGAVSGMCSRWSYNLAVNYVEFLKGRSLKAGGQLASGGNANNNNEYYRNLVKLGYTQTKSTGLSKARVIELIETTTWGYGDVIAYWCNDGPKGESHVKYGHTQVYVGEINSSKWTTSTKTNYNTNFPYRSRKGNNWNYLVFRAPSK